MYFIALGTVVKERHGYRSGSMTPLALNHNFDRSMKTPMIVRPNAAVPIKIASTTPTATPAYFRTDFILHHVERVEHPDSYDANHIHKHIV
jgi:hypothetical protein